MATRLYRASGNGMLCGLIKPMEKTMSDSRYKSETKIKGDRKPRANYCGDCGEECDGLLCDECLNDVRRFPILMSERSL